MSYRFHPLRDYPRAGILVVDGKPVVARFIRRNQESERAERNLKFVASSRSDPTPGEAAKP